MNSTTAAPAPALIPNIPGSASPLRVIPCNTTPAIPKPIPTSPAMTIRGKRNSNITRSNFEFDSIRSNVLMTSITDISKTPFVICK
ncbi:hypothetical protein D9M72_613230 [compost metagenome]